MPEKSPGKIRSSLSTIRNQFAEIVTGGGGGDASRVGMAFAAVRREDFLNRGPWQVYTPEGYAWTPSDDPALLYEDVVVAISPQQEINNGLPSLHAKSLTAAEIAEGETVVHVGVGAGYYTALLAYLAGPRGKVYGYEIDKPLADLATHNLRSWPNVKVINRSGAVGDLPKCDVVYVCAGASSPAETWLDCLGPGGRLIFPLTPDIGMGSFLKITKRGDRYRASFITPASFIACQGMRDPEEVVGLQRAFDTGGLSEVRSLFRDETPDDSAWMVWKHCWLSTRD